jgi:hypothetical protein
MRIWPVAVLAALLMPTLVAQTKQKKSDVSAVFANARYVYVRAQDGDITRPSLYPEDRDAISDVEDGIRDWNRYALTMSREHADLIFIVRRGRAVAAQGQVGISPGPRPPGGQPRQPGQLPDNGTEVGAGAEVGPSDDILQVYTTDPNGKLLGPIWHRELRDGLEGPAVPLLQQLRAAVEKAYPKQTAQKP